MKIKVIGVNHKTTPIDIREKFCLSPIERELLLSEFKSEPSVAEALVLSTCNRTEIYAHVLSDESDILIQTLFRVKKLGPHFDLEKHFYCHSDKEAVHHLMRVTTGLDSLVIGEKQILGQIKEAVELSRKKEMMGKPFNILSNVAVRAGKKARSETQIDCGGSSVSWAAVEMAQKILGSLQDKSVLIIGAGKMSYLAASHLKKKGVDRIFVVNRTSEKASELACQFGGVAASFWDTKDILENVDVCICSAGAPHYLIEKGLVTEIMTKRNMKKLIFIDISVPRNINPAVSSVKNVFLMTVDDLKNVVDGNMKKREAAIVQVEEIITRKVREFYEKLSRNNQSSELVSATVGEKMALRSR